MPRPPLDREAVIDAALTLFRKRGYDGADYTSLVAATGASRNGLYAAFGDKQTLYRAALEHYCAQGLDQLFAPLNEGAQDAHALPKYLWALAQQVAYGHAPDGCFAQQVAADASARGADMKGELSGHADALSERLCAHLRRAGHPDPDTQAHYANGIIQALMAFARLGAAPTVVLGFARPAIAQLAPDFIPDDSPELAERSPT